jgi:predicted ArsR family transcriptional regulator
VSSSPATLSDSRRRPRWLDVIADPVRLQIVQLLSQIPEATASELARRGQASNQTLRRHLEALEASGVILARPGRSDGETSGRPATRFSLSPEVRESVCAVFGEAA